MRAGDFDQAARHFRKALAVRPRRGDLWLALGRAEMAGHRIGAARTAFLRSASLSPADPMPWIWVGYGFEHERRYDEALAADRRACAAAPADARPFRVLGSRLLRWGEAARAIAPLTQAGRLDPTRPRTCLSLGLAYHASERRTDAETWLATCARSFPRHLGVSVALGAVRVTNGNYRGALEVYRGITRRYPTFAPAFVAQALLLDTLGDLAGAEAAFRRAVEVAADKAPYRARLAAYLRFRRAKASGLDPLRPARVTRSR